MNKNNLQFDFNIKARSFAGFKRIKAYVKGLYKESDTIYRDKTVDPLLKKLIIYTNFSDVLGKRVECPIKDHHAFRTLATILNKARVIELHIVPPNKKRDCSYLYPSTNFDIFRIEKVPYLKSSALSVVNTAELLEGAEKDDKFKLMESIPLYKREEFGLDVLDKYNELNREHGYTYKNLTFSTDLRRIFKHTNHDIRLTADEGIGYFQYGRLYGNNFSLSNVSSNIRKQVKIDGENVVEVDYRSCAPNILYACKGIQPLSDAYKIDNSKLEREKLKYAMMVMMFSESRESAINACRMEWTTFTEGDFTTPIIPTNDIILPYIEALEKKHDVIKEYFYQGISGEIQRLDSQLIINIMKYALRDNVPFFSIHDSIIVKKSDKDWAVKTMKKVFFNFFGNEIDVKVEQEIDK